LTLVIGGGWWSDQTGSAYMFSNFLPIARGKQSFQTIDTLCIRNTHLLFANLLVLWPIPHLTFFATISQADILTSATLHQCWLALSTTNCTTVNDCFKIRDTEEWRDGNVSGVF